MPRFTLTGTAGAPVEDVWKLLFDPTRYPEWWVGVESMRIGPPRADRERGWVTVSCQASAIEFVWQLAEHGDGTRITVRVDLPPDLAELLEPERAAVTASLAALATVAAADHRPTATGANHT